MQIGERISYLRDREGISQSALAKEIGATRAAVNAWEMGISNPNMLSLIELTSYFHVSMDYLLGLDNSEFISLETLSGEEKKIVMHLIHYFESIHGK